jgi:hypothetical protein
LILEAITHVIAANPGTVVVITRIFRLITEKLSIVPPLSPDLLDPLQLRRISSCSNKELKLQSQISRELHLARLIPR